MTIETTLKQHTAIDYLGVRAVDCGKAADRLKARCKTQEELDRAQTHLDYLQGQAIGFIDAQKIMDKELRRLCNRFQNGILTVSDFGLVL